MCHEEEYQRNYVSFFLIFVWQMEAVISSTIYLACREEGYPRTMKEMCAVGTVTKKDLGKVFKTVPKNKSTKNIMWERCENNTRCPARFCFVKTTVSNKIMPKVN